MSSLAVLKYIAAIKHDDCVINYHASALFNVKTPFGNRTCDKTHTSSLALSLSNFMSRSFEKVKTRIGSTSSWYANRYR